jgi:DNA-binding PadR family transcriptional regulator
MNSRLITLNGLTDKELLIINWTLQNRIDLMAKRKEYAESDEGKELLQEMKTLRSKIATELLFVYRIK